MLVTSSLGGLLYSEMCRKYRLDYKVDLDPLGYGQTRVLGLCCQVSDVVTIQEVDNGRDWLLLPVSRSVVLSQENNTEVTRASHAAKDGGISSPLNRKERSCLYKGLNGLMLTTFSFFLTARRGQTWPVRRATEFLKQHNTVSNYSLPNLP